MTDHDEEPMDGASAEAAEALLAGLLDASAREAPAWIDALNRWLAVGVLELPAGRAAPRGVADRFEEIEARGPGRWLLAAEVPARGDGPDADRLHELTAALRAALAAHARGRAVLVVDPGARGAGGLLGEAPDLAGALYRAVRDAGGHGLYVDGRVHQTLGEPASPEHGGFRLATGRRRRFGAPALVIGALAAALVLGVFGWQRLGAPPAGPQAHIYVSGEPARLERGPRPDQWRVDDVITVTIEGEPGAYGTLVLLDSRDRLQLPDPAVVNFGFDAESTRATARFQLDDQPGLERFLALVTRAPVPDAAALVAAANEGAGDRDARVRRLREALTSRLGAGAWHLAEARDLQHVE